MNWNFSSKPSELSSMGAIRVVNRGVVEAVGNTLPFLDEADGISLSESVLAPKPKPKPKPVPTSDGEFDRALHWDWMQRRKALI